MKHRALRSLATAPGLAVALVLAFATLPVADARGAVASGSAASLSRFSAGGSVPGVRFIHVATATNTIGSTTYIDHPLTNNNPGAILFVTQNSTPGGVLGAFNDRSIGVRYGATGRWAIFNQDLTGMPVGASFNVLIPDAGSGVLVHEATAANTVGNVTYVDHPLTNSNPSAIMFVTQNLSGGAGGIYNDHSIGVWYDDAAEEWAVFNQDGAGIPEGAAFNILVPGAGTEVFVHTVTSATSSASTFIDHPLTNSNPKALLYVTHNYNPGGVGDIANNHSIAVMYSATAEKWVIWNQDGIDMIQGAAFNVVVPTTDADFIVHEATEANMGDYLTYIDHPLANDNPNAIMFVTQNWNPGGVGGTTNAHSIGVRYMGKTAQWAIFNQDLGAITAGAAFNVLIPNVDAGVFVHQATSVSVDGYSTYLDHPLTNGNPDAILFVTQNYNPSGVSGTYNDRHIMVWYNELEAKWAITNQGYADMPVGAAFNVLVLASDTSVFVHSATEANCTGALTIIDHPSSNDNPAAMVWVTQNYDAGGAGGTYNDHPLGVRYHRSVSDSWAIFNQDREDMPSGALFNVMVKVKRYEVYLPLVVRSP
jgi:hypothetical protein